MEYGIASIGSSIFQDNLDSSCNFLSLFLPKTGEKTAKSNNNFLLPFYDISFLIFKRIYYITLDYIS